MGREKIHGVRTGRVQCCVSITMPCLAHSCCTSNDQHARVLS